MQGLTSSSIVSMLKSVLRRYRNFSAAAASGQDHDGGLTIRSVRCWVVHHHDFNAYGKTTVLSGNANKSILLCMSSLLAALMASVSKQEVMEDVHLDFCFSLKTAQVKEVTIPVEAYCHRKHQSTWLKTL